jgi:hypothetical protein
VCGTSSFSIQPKPESGGHKFSTRLTGGLRYDGIVHGSTSGWLRVLAPLVLLAAAAGCAGDMPPPQGDVVLMETAPVDMYLWPDYVSPGDTWPTGDSYSGAPFGCRNDSDCFGQRCCPTPWGVKLCAPTCS